MSVLAIERGVARENTMAEALMVRGEEWGEGEWRVMSGGWQDARVAE